jgi:hypothetical protein
MAYARLGGIRKPGCDHKAIDYLKKAYDLRGA